MGRIGMCQTTFTVANLNKVVQRVATSSGVLSSQRAALRDAIYRVNEKNQLTVSTNPLQQGQKLIPSVTRVLSKARDMYVFFCKRMSFIRPIRKRHSGKRRLWWRRSVEAICDA